MSNIGSKDVSVVVGASILAIGVFGTVGDMRALVMSGFMGVIVTLHVIALTRNGQ